jgi:hypothetical protein
MSTAVQRPNTLSGGRTHCSETVHTVPRPYTPSIVCSAAVDIPNTPSCVSSVRLLLFRGRAHYSTRIWSRSITRSIVEEGTMYFQVRRRNTIQNVSIFAHMSRIPLPVHRQNSPIHASLFFSKYFCWVSSFRRCRSLANLKASSSSWSTFLSASRNLDT